MTEVFYRKVGRRYQAVRQYDPNITEAFPYGAHLVVVKKGSTSYRYQVDPALAPMIAAGIYAEDAVSQAVVEAAALRPQTTPLTLDQIDAWEKFSKTFGDSMYTVETASAHEIAQAGVRAMQEEAAKLMQNPAVAQAYEHFQLMCKLAAENPQ